MRVRRLSTSKKGYGGIIYEKMIDEALSSRHDYQIVSAAFSLKGIGRLLEAPVYLFKQYIFAKRTDAFLIRSFQSAFFNFKKSGLTVIYHIDSSGSSFLPRVFQDITEWVFKVVIRKSEHIVVIAEYWKQYFVDKGYSNVHLIYCGFELEKYSISDEEVKQFLDKYSLVGKKVIYVGNPQFKKGAHIVADALKGSEYTLITSGVRDQNVHCLHLDLDFKSYLCLLKASSVVVLMSQFAEGWNRIAHEALLMGTPVIGTGYGGMKEVLEGGRQEICRDPSQLPGLIEKVISNRSYYAGNGLNFAKQFGVDRFNNDWLNLVSRLSQEAKK